MSFGYGWRGPNIVKDGLVFYVDAGSPNSYYSPTAGITWKDISGNGNNGTLTNGPTFDSANGGSIVFDGSDDYVTIGNPSILQITDKLTLSAWIKTTNNSTISTIIGKDGISTGTRSYLINLATTGEPRFFIFKSGSNTSVFGTTQVNDGNWHHVMCVNDGIDLKIYVDGILENTTVGGGGTMLNGTSFFAIGRREANAPQNIHWFNGNIANTLVYNRALSATEVLQNYNATKTRFGL